MKIIISDRLPPANGHYSQCIEHNGTLYLSGQLPIDPDTRKIPEGIKAQAQQALSNIDTVLRAAGSSREKVINVRIYVSDIALWDAVNEVYSSFFGGHKPVRCVIPVRELHFGALIEIEAAASV